MTESGFIILPELTGNSNEYYKLGSKSFYDIWANLLFSLSWKLFTACS